MRCWVEHALKSIRLIGMHDGADRVKVAVPLAIGQRRIREDPTRYQRGNRSTSDRDQGNHLPTLRKSELLASFAPASRSGRGCCCVSNGSRRKKNRGSVDDLFYFAVKFKT